MNKATFFITTARSGTQWLCDTLHGIYSDLLVVEHEPIRYAYAPKRHLRDPHAISALRANSTVRRHLDEIHHTLEQRSYVEIGFPAFAAAPLLWEEFGPRLRLVQLVRHPVRVAASLTTHCWYDQGQRPDIESDIAVTPADPGAQLPHYAENWQRMSAFEKGLFFWTEVHLFGMEVQRTLPQVPFHQVRFEDLLSRPAEVEALVRFLELPFRPGWSEAAQKNVDRFRKRVANDIGFRDFRPLPETAALASRFGYDLRAVSARDVHRRYEQSLAANARNLARRRLRGALARIGQYCSFQR